MSVDQLRKAIAAEQAERLAECRRLLKAAGVAVDERCDALGDLAALDHRLLDKSDPRGRGAA